MAVEDDRRGARRPGDGHGRRDLVHDDDVRAVARGAQRDRDHPHRRAERVAPSENPLRQPVAGDDDAQRAVAGLVEAAPRVVPRRVDRHVVAPAPQAERRVDDEPLRAAEAEVRVGEGDF